MEIAETDNRILLTFTETARRNDAGPQFNMKDLQRALLALILFFLSSRSGEEMGNSTGSIRYEEMVSK